MTTESRGEETHKGAAIRVVNEDKRELHIVNLSEGTNARHNHLRGRHNASRDEDAS